MCCCLRNTFLTFSSRFGVLTNLSISQTWIAVIACNSSHWFFFNTGLSNSFSFNTTIGKHWEQKIPLRAGRDKVIFSKWTCLRLAQMKAAFSSHLEPQVEVGASSTAITASQAWEVLCLFFVHSLTQLICIITICYSPGR